MTIKECMENFKKYFNYSNLMQITNIFVSIYLLRYVHFPISWEDVYGFFIYAFPFLVNIFTIIHINKYEQFYSRDILIALVPLIYIGFLMLCIAVTCILFSGLS